MSLTDRQPSSIVSEGDEHCCAPRVTIIECSYLSAATDHSLGPIPKFRPDFDRLLWVRGERRSLERLIAHYKLERELSDRLRAAPREQRSSVYTAVYTELFTSLPDHPQRAERGHDADDVRMQIRKLDPFLTPDSTFLEIGCGDSSLTFAAARRVAMAYGVDVTDALVDFAVAPPNFKLLKTSGIEIPLPDASIDLAYSHQFLEHIHPDDAKDQVREVYRVLKFGGRYLCITPSRLTGPHDISCFFNYDARGLHLKEYDYGSLRALFSQAGFREIFNLAWIKGRQIKLPYRVARAVEQSLWALPISVRAMLTQTRPIQAIMGLNAIAKK
jgi:SAM-dependent methyltransferase